MLYFFSAALESAYNHEVRNSFKRQFEHFLPFSEQVFWKVSLPPAGIYLMFRSSKTSPNCGQTFAYVTNTINSAGHRPNENWYHPDKTDVRCTNWRNFLQLAIRREPSGKHKWLCCFYHNSCDIQQKVASSWMDMAATNSSLVLTHRRDDKWRTHFQCSDPKIRVSWMGTGMISVALKKHLPASHDIAV